MGIRNTKKEGLDRLARKLLDDGFIALVRDGLNCSPFEASAVLQAVLEVYGPYLGAVGPGLARAAHAGRGGRGGASG